jgi:hypothetical protein
MQDEILRTTSQPEIPKMQIEEDAAPVSDSQAVVEAETAPPDDEVRQPEPEQAAQPAPADESPAPKKRSRAATSEAKPPKAEDIFSRLDAYEAEKATPMDEDRPPKTGFLNRILDWLNRET